MNKIEILTKDEWSVCPIFHPNTRVLVMKDVPISVMIKDVTGKLEHFYLAYNVYLINDLKFEIRFSQPMKFKKEIYYQIFHQVILDIYGNIPYLKGDSANFMKSVSSVFNQMDYNLFKLVPLWRAENKIFCWNSRIMHAKIAEYNYFACNFKSSDEIGKRRIGFLLWRE